MPLLMTRYDLRRPDFCQATRSELYQAAIDQVEWADRHNFLAVVVSEHHSAEDGYLPSSRVMAGAFAARTKNIQIHLSALIAPLHDPVRLAEDLAVLSLMSNGRIVPIISAGYREEEFVAIGKSLSDRKAYMDMIMPFLRQAFTGEPFEYLGQEIVVTPKPDTMPMLVMGGSTKVAARRAARDADYFIPAVPEVFEEYRAELKRLGKPDMGASAKQPSTCYFAADDPDAFWDELAPHAMHEQNSYAEWAEKSGVPSPYSFYSDKNSLRDSGKYTVLTAEQMIDQFNTMHKNEPLIMSPLVGGLSPSTSWHSLHTFDHKVFPFIGESGTGVFKD